MIYTFYSYKGGVGRSMAMANVAERLYQQGKRVVMIDWDLEAPGLEGYFAPEDKLEEIKSKPGLIDILLEYKSRYVKLNRELAKAYQEIEIIARKLSDKLSERDINWLAIEQTLGIYASFRKDDVAMMIKDLHAMSGSSITINDIARLIESRIADPALADSFTIHISDKIKEGKLDLDEVEIYLSTYALLDRDELTSLVQELKDKLISTGINTVNLPEILSKYFSPQGLISGENIHLKGLSKLEEHFVSMHALSPSEKGGLWLLTAGKREGDNFTAYSRAVQDFNWSEFYASYNGEAYFEWFRNQLLGFADIVLIDSRTGVSEMSGVSTRHLADRIVVITAPNAQNIWGMANMVKSFINQDLIDKRGRDLGLIVVPSRVDLNESLLLNQFEAKFHRTIEGILGKDVSKVFWELAIPYIPYYNYRDELVVGVSDAPEELESSGKSRVLDTAYKKLTSYLVNGNFDSLDVSAGKLADPYIGLTPFQAKDTKLFFGRALEIEKMVNILKQHEFLIVSGPSGSGKSSLLNAGLIPVLKDKMGAKDILDKEFLFFKPGAHPIVALCDAIIGNIGIQDAENKEKGKKLLRLFTAMPDTFNENLKDSFGVEKQFIIVIDQFEEVFKLCSDEKERADFINAIGAWIQAKEVVVILSIRSDFFSQLLQYPAIAKNSEQAVMSVGMPGERELRDIMMESAHRSGVKFQQGLVERLLKDIENVNKKLSVLQVILKELWLNRSENMFTHGAYDKIGGVDGVLRQLYEGAFKLISQQEMDAASPVLVYIANSNTKVRQRLKLSELTPEGKRALQPFVDSGLLIVETDVNSKEETVMLAHDMLMTGWPQLNELISKEIEFVQWREKLKLKMEYWNDSKMIDDLLLSANSAADANKWLGSHEKYLFPGELAYIDKSKVYREKLKNRKIGYAVMAVTLIVVFAVAYFKKEPVLNDEVVKKEKAYQFTQQYTSNENKDMAFNLEMLKKYYLLDNKYRDSLINIKTEIENNISFNFAVVLDELYSDIRNNRFKANTYFTDTVMRFGGQRNISNQDIQTMVDAFSKGLITNHIIDSTFRFYTDSNGFYAVYTESGNVLIDKGQEFLRFEISDTVTFTENFRIRSLVYKTLKTTGNVTVLPETPVKMRIDLFTCDNGMNEEANIKGIMNVLRRGNFYVNRKSFTSSSDTLSPYYVRGYEIRYNGKKEYEIAERLQREFQKENKTRLWYSLREVRTVTPGIISIFICRGSVSKG